MSMIINNTGPGTIDKVVVNGEPRFTNVVFKKSCKIVVGDYIEIDGDILFKAKKGDNFYCNQVNCTEGSSVNNFF